MDEKYLVELTYSDGEKSLQLWRVDSILEGFVSKGSTKRYFKLPAIESLEEVTVDINITKK